MIDEINYFPKRDQYKKKKSADLDEDWNALKKLKKEKAPQPPVNKKRSPENPPQENE